MLPRTTGAKPLRAIRKAGDKAGDIAHRARLRTRLQLSAAIVVLVLFVATIGYWLFWRDIGGTLLDGFFMAFTTITTIGYGEVKPLSSAARIFTFFISVAGISSLFYTFGVLMENVVVTQLSPDREKKRMQQKIDVLKDHIIIVGMSRVGRLAMEEVAATTANIVVVDRDQSNIGPAKALGIPFVIGDATTDEVLKKAGIERAKGLITTTSNDASNVFIVLSARVLNPSIYIVSRAENETSIDKLMRAGADKAVDPYEIGGQRLANLMVHPLAVDFFETTLRLSEQDLSIEFIMVNPKSAIAGKSLREIDIRRVSGASILAVVREGKAEVNPGADYTIHSNDQLVAFGTNEQLRRLEALANK